MDKVSSPAVGNSWKEVEKEIFTEDEICKSDLRISLMNSTIEARREKGITQKELEKLSGVKQPHIARIECGDTSPQINTVMKLLSRLGKTLKIVPID